MVCMKKATAASVEVQWPSRSSLIIFILQDFTSKDLLMIYSNYMLFFKLKYIALPISSMTLL